MKSKAVRFLSVFVLAGLLLPAPSFAQAKTDSSRRALKAKSDSSRALLKTRMDSTHFSIDSLKIRLALTPEQEMKIREIIKVNREQAKQDRELYKGVATAQLRAAKERFDKSDGEILALLDANQKKKYEALKKERLGRIKETQKTKAPKKETTSSTP